MDKMSTFQGANDKNPALLSYRAGGVFSYLSHSPGKMYPVPIRPERYKMPSAAMAAFMQMAERQARFRHLSIFCSSFAKKIAMREKIVVATNTAVATKRTALRTFMLFSPFSFSKN